MVFKRHFQQYFSYILRSVLLVGETGETGENPAIYRSLYKM